MGETASDEKEQHYECVLASVAVDTVHVLDGKKLAVTFVTKVEGLPGTELALVSAKMNEFVK